MPANPFLKIILAPIVLLAATLPLSSQIIEQSVSPIINTDSLRREFDKGPFYSLYKDNYFAFGPSLRHADKDNTNVKFQVSVQVKVTKTVLPFHSYLYFYYTQKVIWDVLRESAPMRDLNFNPGLGIARPYFRNGRYFGKLSLEVEHESNGRDSIQSRSWNRVTLGANALLDNNIMLYGKVWVPFWVGVENRNIRDYCGVFQFGGQYMTRNRRWSATIYFTKRKGWNLSGNIVAEASWKFSRDTDWCLFAQFYNGYGENLLDYNRFRNQLRVGIVIRPSLFSDF